MEKGFLKDKYNLHKSEEVESASRRAENRTGEKVPQNPHSRIQNYLDRFSEILEREDEYKRERGLEAIKKVIYKNYVIKPEEIPQGYFENQRRIAREQGHGDIEISEEMRNQLTEVIIADQRSSLDAWIDYLSSPDATYPDWLKYWAIRSILSMGEFDKEKKQFTNRSKGTTKPFPDLNREALAYVLDIIQKKRNGGEIQVEDEEREKFEKILESENFAKLYAWAIEKVTPAEKDLLLETQGEWVKYEKGSDHMPLVNSLQGHGTGWCTAGESTASTQLQGGDFYVYYSKDQRGDPTIPRVAIRIQDENIAEVRGIAKDQNLDPYIGDIAKEKLKEFPDGKAYEKKSEDMKRLTEIERKTKQNQELTKEDLRFIYEIDSEIQGFGYEEDPRAWEIRESRDVRNDLSFALDIPLERITYTGEEDEEKALSGGILYHYGDLDLNSVTSVDGLKLPQNIRGGLYLGSLKSAEGLKLPENIGGDLDLSGITSVDGLKLPQNIRGGLYLYGLTSAEGLKLPESVGGGLNLGGLTSAKNVVFPKKVGGYINISSLAYAEDIKFPESTGGYNFNLESLVSAKRLELPRKVGALLNLSHLVYAEDVKFPESVGGDIYLSSLVRTEDLSLPEKVDGSIDLNNLISVKRLKFPKKIRGHLDLSGLESAQNIELPEVIYGDIHLSSLTSAKNLVLPREIGGYINLSNIPPEERNMLREKHTNLTIFGP